MRPLYSLAALSVSAADENLAQVLSSLNLDAPAQSGAAGSTAAGPVASSLDPLSAVGGAASNVLGQALNQSALSAISPVSIGGLLQSVTGDGTQTSGIYALQNLLGGTTPTLPTNSTTTLDLGTSALQDPTSLINSSSLSNLFPALTNGLLTNQGVGNLLNTTNALASQLTTPDITSSLASLTNSPLLQNINTLSNIGSTVNSLTNAANALAANAAGTTGTTGAKTGLDLTSLTSSILGSIHARRLDTASDGLAAIQNSISKLTQSLQTGTLDLNSLLGSNSNALDLNSLTNTLTGGLAGSGANALNLGTLTQNLQPSLEALTQSLGSIDTSKALQSLQNSTASLLPLTTNTTSLSASSLPRDSTIDGFVAAYLNDGYLNQEGQAVIKSSGYALQAMQYPDLAVVINGQAPATDSAGNLTTPVRAALKQMGIDVTTPSQFLSVLMSAVNTGSAVPQLNNNSILSSSSLLPTLNTTSLLDPTGLLAQQNSALESLLNTTNATATTNALTNSLTSSLSSLLNPTAIGTDTAASVVASNNVASAATNSTSASNSTRLLQADEFDGLKKALQSFNEALKHAIQVEEKAHNVESKSEDDIASSTSTARRLRGTNACVPTKCVNGDCKAVDCGHKRMLTSWFSDAWGSVKNAFKNYDSENKDNDEWKDDLNKAAQELAENLSEMAEKLKSTDVADMVEQWFESSQARVDKQGSSKRLLEEEGDVPAVEPEEAPADPVAEPDEQDKSQYQPQVAFESSRSGAYGAAYDGYQFQEANGTNVQTIGLTTNNADKQLQQLLAGLTGNDMMANMGLLSQPLLSSFDQLTNPLMGALGGFNQNGMNQQSGNGALTQFMPQNILGQLLNGNLGLLGNNNNNDFQNALATPQNGTMVSVSMMAAQPSVEKANTVQAKTVQLNGMLAEANATMPANATTVANTTNVEGDKINSLNGIDMKDWIDELGSTKMGELFGLDNIDVSKLPALPDIEDDKLEQFLKDQDWKSLFDSINLTKLPGLEHYTQSELKDKIAAGQLGEVLANLDLKKVPGLEKADVKAIQSELLKDNIDKALPYLGNVTAISVPVSHLRQLATTGTSALDIINQGSSALNNQLSQGTNNVLSASSNALTDQLGGLSSLTNGLTGLSQGLAYGLTGINTGAVQGTSLLNNGISSLLGKINEGVGNNLGNLGSGLTGLTGSIGENLGSGLGELGTSLGSNSLSLPDLSSLNSLIPTDSASVLANATESLVNPLMGLSSFGLLPDSATGTTSGTSGSSLTSSLLPSTDAYSLLGLPTTSTLSIPTLAPLPTLAPVASNDSLIQLLNSLYAQRRQLDDVAAVNTASSLLPENLLSSLASQYSGLNEVTAGINNFTRGLTLGLSGLGTGINQGTGMIGFGTNALLGNLNSGLGAQLGNIGNGLGVLMPNVGNNVGVGLGNISNQMGSPGLGILTDEDELEEGKALQAAGNSTILSSTNTNSTLTGVAIPDIRNILGSDTSAAPAANAAATGLPDLTQLLNNSAAHLLGVTTRRLDETPSAIVPISADVTATQVANPISYNNTDWQIQQVQLQAEIRRQLLKFELEQTISSLKNAVVPQLMIYGNDQQTVAVLAQQLRAQIQQVSQNYASAMKQIEQATSTQIAQIKAAQQPVTTSGAASATNSTAAADDATKDLQSIDAADVISKVNDAAKSASQELSEQLQNLGIKMQDSDALDTISSMFGTSAGKKTAEVANQLSDPSLTNKIQSATNDLMNQFVGSQYPDKIASAANSLESFFNSAKDESNKVEDKAKEAQQSLASLGSSLKDSLSNFGTSGVGSGVSLDDIADQVSKYWQSLGGSRRSLAAGMMFEGTNDYLNIPKGLADSGSVIWNNQQFPFLEGAADGAAVHQRDSARSASAAAPSATHHSAVGNPSVHSGNIGSAHNDTVSSLDQLLFGSANHSAGESEHGAQRDATGRGGSAASGVDQSGSGGNGLGVQESAAFRQLTDESITNQQQMYLQALLSNAGIAQQQLQQQLQQQQLYQQLLQQQQLQSQPQQQQQQRAFQGVSQEPQQSTASSSSSNSIPALLKSLASSNLDLNQIVKVLSESDMDWNEFVKGLANGSVTETQVPGLLKQHGVDMDQLLATVNASDLDVDQLKKMANENKDEVTRVLEKLRASNLNLNAMLAKLASDDVDANGLLLMLQNSGADLDEVAQSDVLDALASGAALADLAPLVEDIDHASPYQLQEALDSAQAVFEA